MCYLWILDMSDEKLVGYIYLVYFIQPPSNIYLKYIYYSIASREGGNIILQFGNWVEGAMWT